MPAFRTSRQRGSLVLDSEIEAFFEALQQLFEEQNTAAILDMFSEPLPIYSESGITLLSRRADTTTSIERLTSAARASGVTQIKRRILSVQTTRGKRGSMCHVEWYYLGARGDIITTTEVKYYCGPDKDGTTRILMMEYLRAAFPEALSEMPEEAPQQYLLN